MYIYIVRERESFYLYLRGLCSLVTLCVFRMQRKKREREGENVVREIKLKFGNKMKKCVLLCKNNGQRFFFFFGCPRLPGRKKKTLVDF